MIAQSRLEQKNPARIQRRCPVMYAYMLLIAMGAANIHQY